MSGFQKQVNQYPAPAVEGDFASTNPRSIVIAGEGALVAGPAGVTVGRFGWLSGNTVRSYGTYPAAPAGFVAREGQATITTWLAEYGNTIQAGQPVTLDNQGDFWVKNTSSDSAAVGDAVYATYGTGAATHTSAATGASVTGSIGGSVTASIGSTSTGTGSGTDLTLASLTGYVSIGDKVSGTGVPANTVIVSQTSGTTGLAGVYVTNNATTISGTTALTFGDVLWVTAVGSGTVQPGDIISGTGIPSGATIVAPISPATTGTGKYTIDTAGATYQAGTTVTVLSTVMVVTVVGSGALAVGMPVSGSNITANSVITALGTGTGLTGTYVVSLGSTAASTTITGAGGVATKWKVASAAAAGELMKITSWS